MKRHKLIMTGAAILVFGVAFAAKRTAVDADRHLDRPTSLAKWQPGSDIPMSAYGLTELSAGRPR